MKSREEKQKDLDTLTAEFKEASAGTFISFQRLTVAKDQEIRKQLRDAGIKYAVVKNTLARRAAVGTPFEQAAEHLKGTTALALSKNDPVNLSKTISKFAKENPDIFTFKVGIVEGKVVALEDFEAIANLPSKEELISKMMFIINSQAQRLVTVLSAVPRNLAVVVKQIGEKKGGEAA
ncbi:MAG: 50S ribosomal protein L10 [Pyrinomonadaceae bacterium]|nr:50S ribosomal protein L10 [Pyrinomonadaceae bacterium]